MELLVQLLIGIAWPIAVIWIAYLFKGEVRLLLKRMSQFKYKDVEAKFEGGLAERQKQKLLQLKNQPHHYHLDQN